MLDQNGKLEALKTLLRDLGSVVVGFSGGTDSAFLAAAAHRVLGERAVAVTCYSPTLPKSEQEEAIANARLLGIRHVLLQHNELDSEDFVRNDADRCYYCKKSRSEAILIWAETNGFRWVLEGSNADDVGDYRPGMRAVSEMENVRSPLLEVGLTKHEIRELSKLWGLPTWNKPSAACLSSRVAYGQNVTVEKLSQIEQAEALVKRYWQGQVRVRHHGSLARIEVDSEGLTKLVQPSVATEVATKLKALGFKYVTVDLAGYRTGSMNLALELEKV